MDTSERPTPILSPAEIEALMNQASPEEREVLVKRFGLDQDRYRTLGETSDSVGRSIEEVQAIEERAVTRFTDTTRKVAMNPGAQAGLPGVPGPARGVVPPSTAQPD